MNHWDNIWLKKGEIASNDLRVLNGYEKTGADFSDISFFIFKTLKLQKNNSVLEVGCGAGLLGQYFREWCSYCGADKSKTLVRKHKNILNNSVLVSEACSLPFKNDSFDAVFSFGVFHYFPSILYAKETVMEMQRISKNLIFIGDLPFDSHDSTHLLFKPTMFNGGIITNGLYEPNASKRFNIQGDKSSTFMKSS